MVLTTTQYFQFDLKQQYDLINCNYKYINQEKI